ncbi:MAG: single-stranded DNA-binding protein [Candidatus Cloacimonas sp.]|jgi:single-strand DNA-binding protein|nr:single-stranded DNA-binding protein [Candidatus Cloacimonas sp.]
MADLKLPRLNKFIVSGRIGNDIELKYTPKGTPVVRFVVASDRRYKDETDQWQSVTSWIDCIAWSKWAEFMGNNTHKGSAVIVEGRIDTSSWTDQDNVKHKRTEVVVDMVQTLEWKPRDEGANPHSDEVPLPPEESAPHSATSDDVPF